MTHSANPNTQPIYPDNPLVWHTRLKSQVNGYDPMNNTVVNPPVLLGRASESGALLEHVSFFSMYQAPPAGSGGSAGDIAAAGPVGLGTPGDERVVFFYSRRAGTTELVPILQVGLSTTAQQQAFRWGFFPIIPDPQVGLRMAAGEELYIALNKALPGPGLWVSVRGGHYSLDGQNYFGTTGPTN